MIILDAHQDIAYNALCFQRDYRQSALLHREREAGAHPAATIGLPDALLGRVGLIFATLWVAPRGSVSWATPGADITYTNAAQAYSKAMQQFDYYQRLADEDARVQLVRYKSDLAAVLKSWEPGTDSGAHRQGLVVLMEGADPILEPRQFEEWYERGVRIVGPAWTQTRYSGGTGAPGGLTLLGRELLEMMSSYNCMLDLSHLAEQAYYEALEIYEGPIIASHSNPRRFHDSDRSLSDQMIRLLAERGGVMGIVLYNRFLSRNWSSGDPKERVGLSIVMDAIDHICQVTGSAAHVGIGSDFDGGFGAGSIPDGLDTVTDLWNLGTTLVQRGYNEDDIEAILGGNMLRQLRAALPD